MVGYAHRATGHLVSRKTALIVSALLLSILSGCASLPSDTLPVVHDVKRVPVIPPANLLAYCTSIPSDGSIGQEIERLDNLAKCEHDRLDALNVWAKENQPAADADTAPPEAKQDKPAPTWLQRNNPF